MGAGNEIMGAGNEIMGAGNVLASLVPRPSRNAERGSGVLSDISWGVVALGF